MKERTALTATITVGAAIVAIMAVALQVTPGPTGTASGVAREQEWRLRLDTAYRSPQDLISCFHGGRDILSEYFGKAASTDEHTPSTTAQCPTPTAASVSAPNPGIAPTSVSGLPKDEATPLRTLIVTLPDPFDSHLDWIFDAHLDAMRRAFAAADFVPDRYSLNAPGDSVWVGPTGLSRHRARREYQPGVMLFRGEREKELWLVYVVHELPTTGVYRYALQAALHEIGDLRSHRDTALPVTLAEPCVINVLGPTFSGSASSLLQEVQKNIRSDACPNGEEVQVVSGSATQLRGEPRQGTGDLIATTVHSDSTMGKVFLKLAERLVGSPAHVLDRVAVLAEGQTGYGAALPGLGHLQTIHFPLNIASLHTAFDRSADARRDAAGLPGITAQSRTPLSLEPSRATRESPPLTSRLAVPALDLVLRDIERTLITRRIEVVLIVATDIRDKLILARTLRNRLRDVVFVIYEDNMLYLRDEYSHALKGTYVLSTYPLVNAASGVWQDNSAQNLTFFGHDLAVGVYNATLRHVDPSWHEPRAQWPPRDCPVPPVWVSIIGNGTQYPLMAEWPDSTDDTLILAGSRSSDARLDSRTVRTCKALEVRPPATGGVVTVAAIVILLFGMWLPDIDICWWKIRQGRRAKNNHNVAPRSPPLRTGHQLLAVTLWRLALAVPLGALLGILSLRHGAVGVVWLLAILLIAGMSWIVWQYAGRRPVRWLRTEDSTASTRNAQPLMREQLGDVRVRIREQFRAFPDDTDDIEPEDQKSDAVYRIRDNYAYRRRVLEVVGWWLLGLLLVSASATAWWQMELSLGAQPDLKTWMLAHRLTDVFGGASPAGVLLLAGCIVGLWAWWQYLAVRDFRRPAAFELALKDVGRDRSGTSPLRGIGHQLWRIRATLSDYLPDESAVSTHGVVILLVLMSLFGLRRFGPTLETVAEASGSVPMTWLVPAAYGAVLVLNLTGILRFTAAWQALEGLLELFAGSRMVSVFRIIPTDIVRAARPALLGEVSWRAPGFGIRVAPRDIKGRGGPVDWRPQVLERSEDEALAALTMLQNSGAQRAGIASADHVGRLSDLAIAIASAGLFDESRPPAVAAGSAAGTGAPPNTGEPPLDRATKVLAFHFALEVGFFVAQAMFALRRLAITLVLSLGLSILLTRAYPVHAQSLVMWSLALVMIWALASLGYVIAKMSAQPVLHEIAQTDDTGANWGLTVVFSLMVFTALPLLGYLATSMPTVREFMVSWLEPVSRALAR